MILAIDAERCQGHSRCLLVNMDLFDMDDDGNGVVLRPEPGPELAADAARAVKSCPEQAITYS